MPHHSRSPNRTLPQVHTAKLCSVRKANIQNAGVCNDEKAKRIYLRLPCDRQRAVPWPSRVAGQGGGRRARKSGRHRPGRPTPAATVDGLFAFKRFFPPPAPSRGRPLVPHHSLCHGAPEDAALGLTTRTATLSLSTYKSPATLENRAHHKIAA